MRVLVVGYGKIGRIKASLWFAIGAQVFVYDQNDTLRSKILEDGFNIFDSRNQAFDIIDISTPASTHYDALLWSLNLTSDPKVYLIEKPLASSRTELLAFKTLLTNSPGLSRKIVINESYYQSSLIKEVVEDIRATNASIQSIHIELSKNRLGDLQAGRFFDNNLEAIGLEVPHMLAILDMFGISLPRGCKPSLIVDKIIRPNQAFILKTSVGSTSVSLESYLGNFKYQGANVTANNEITRKVIVTTDKLEYQIEFDPLFSHERFHGKLTTLKKGVIRSEKVALDNHLETQLSLVMNEDSLEDLPIGSKGAIEITETLLSLRELCEFTPLEPVEDNLSLNKIESEMSWL